MDTISIITPDYISRAVDEIKKIKPDYGLMLDLYEKIFIEQENSKITITPADYRIPEDVLSVKLREKFPLVSISEFVINTASAEKLFSKICEILKDAGSEISETVKKIEQAIDSGALSTENMFSAFLGENESFFSTIENDLAIDKKILSFVIFNSLKPSLAVFSEKMSEHLDKENVWDRGYCPVCGSRPELSVFEENGKRSLLCGFCGHKWPSKRVFCSYCENTDHETLRYYEIEDEEEYRVDVCDKCKRYIKTVNIKKTLRSIYLPLEGISTPYIDVKFQEMGYKPGNMTGD